MPAKDVNEGVVRQWGDQETPVSWTAKEEHVARSGVSSLSSDKRGENAENWEQKASGPHRIPAGALGVKCQQTRGAYVTERA